MHSSQRANATQVASAAPIHGEQPLVTLRVQVVGCINLLARDTWKRTSDPYVVVQLGDDKALTPFVRQSLNPDYPQDKATFDFHIYQSNVKYPVALNFVVWDRDHVWDDYLGEVAIPLNEWFNHSEPSPALAFEDPRNTPFSTAITSTRRGIPAQGTIKVKIGFAPPKPTPSLDYAAIFSTLQQLAGPTSASSIPGESEMEGGDISAADEGSADGVEEGPRRASPTTIRSATISTAPRSRKNTQASSIISPSPSHFSRHAWMGSGPRPRALSRGPRSAMARKAWSYRESAQGLEGSQPASRPARRRPYLEKSNLSPNDDIVGIILLEIQGAASLPKWTNMARTDWDMDPLCVVSFGGKSFDTSVCPHSLNPVWNQKLLLHVHRSEIDNQVNFTVLNFDKFAGNSMIGSVSFAVARAMATAPKSDPETMMYPESVTTPENKREYTLPIVSGDNSARKLKDTSFLKFSVNYQPYSALRQSFWRQCLSSHGENGNAWISRSQLTSILGELGTTLSDETIDSFFTRCGTPTEGSLTLKQTIICLEHQSTAQHNHVEANRKADSGSSFNDVERVINFNIRVCPVCGGPRMIPKGEMDIVLHWAACPGRVGAHQILVDDCAGSKQERSSTQLIASGSQNSPEAADRATYENQDVIQRSVSR